LCADRFSRCAEESGGKWFGITIKARAFCAPHGGAARAVRCADGAGEMKREAGEMCRAGGYCSSVIASESERDQQYIYGVAESPPVYFQHQLLHKSTPVYVRCKSNYCARGNRQHTQVKYKRVTKKPASVIKHVALAAKLLIHKSY
jgi:hypothetical protein